MHVHHDFLYISLPLLHDYDVKFTFPGERDQMRTIFFFFFFLTYIHSRLEF